MKIRVPADRRADERVAAMLKRHVRNQAGSAAVVVVSRPALRQRIDRAA